MRKTKLLVLSVMALTALAGCGEKEVKKNKIDLADEANIAVVEKKVSGVFEGMSSWNSLAVKSSAKANAEVDISKLFFKEGGKESKIHAKTSNEGNLDVEVDGLTGEIGSMYAHARLHDNKNSIQASASINDLLVEVDENGNTIYADEAKTQPVYKEFNIDYALDVKNNNLDVYLNKGIVYIDATSFLNQSTISSLQNVANKIWVDFPQVAELTGMATVPSIGSIASTIFNDYAKYYYDLGIGESTGKIDLPDEEEVAEITGDIMGFVTAEESPVKDFISFYQYSNGDWEVSLDITTEQVKALVENTPKDKKEEPTLNEANGHVAIKFGENNMLKGIELKANVDVEGNGEIGEEDCYITINGGVEFKVDVEIGARVERKSDFDGYTDLTPILDSFLIK